MKPTYYFCKLWRMHYDFCLGWKPEEFKSFLKKKYDYETTMQATATGKFVWLEDGSFCRAFIWTKFTGIKSMPALAHECLHVANYTLDRAGWTPQLTNDEPQTYLMTSLIRQALKLE